MRIVFLITLLICCTPAARNDSFPVGKDVIADLEIICKTWGFLKYYHPTIRTRQIDWDKELIEGIKATIRERNAAKLDSLIDGWLNKLGPFEKGNIVSKAGDIQQVLSPDFSWIDRSGLNESIRAKLSDVKHSRRILHHPQIKKDSLTTIPVFQNEKAYIDVTFPNVEVQLLALFRYWNAVNYFFPYKNLMDDDWEQVLKEFIPKFIRADSRLSYELTLQELVARLNDCHAIVLPDQTLIEHFGINIVPLELTAIKDDFVVTGFLSSAGKLASGVEIGDIIVQVDGVTSNDKIRLSSKYFSESNRRSLLRDVAFNLLKTNRDSVEVIIKKEQGFIKKTLPAVNINTVNPYQRMFKQDTCFKLLSPTIAYINGATLKSHHIDRLVPILMETKGLIVDMRCYPSDLFAPKLCEYLIPRETDFVRFSEFSESQPGVFEIKQSNQVGKRNNGNKVYKGKVIVLINELTQSSGEFQTMALSKIPGCTTIGSTTAGADGNITQLDLPGGVLTMYSGIGVYHADGTPTQRVGLKPQLEITPTIEAIRQNKDEVLDAAIYRVNTIK